MSKVKYPEQVSGQGKISEDYFDGKGRERKRRLSENEAEPRGRRIKKKKMYQAHNLELI